MTAFSPNPTDLRASLAKYQNSMSHRHFIDHQEAKRDRNTSQPRQSTSDFDVLTRLGQSEKDRFRRKNSINRRNCTRNMSQFALGIDQKCARPGLRRKARRWSTKGRQRCVQRVCWVQAETLEQQSETQRCWAKTNIYTSSWAYCAYLMICMQ
jgi:hypothetical protein